MADEETQLALFPIENNVFYLSRRKRKPKVAHLNLTELLRINSEQTDVYQVSDDAMMIARQGDYVLVNKHCLTEDGDYVAVKADAQVAIRYLWIDDSGSCWLIAENLDYAPFDVLWDCNEFEVLGKVSHVLHVIDNTQ